jgi:hypothetical protein
MEDATWKDVTLGEIGGGAAAERFHDALQRVLENIEDPNTPFDAKRKITMTFEFEPDHTRAVADCHIEVQCKLAAPHGVTTTIHVEKERGQRRPKEVHRPQIPLPGQPATFPVPVRDNKPS